MRIFTPKATDSYTQGYNDGYWGREPTKKGYHYLQGYEAGKRTAEAQ